MLFDKIVSVALKNLGMSDNGLKSQVAKRYSNKCHSINFERIDEISLSNLSRKEIVRFFNSPYMNKADVLELLLKPSIENLTINNLSNFFPKTKPIVTFNKEEKLFNLNDDKDTKVFEVARIYLRCPGITEYVKNLKDSSFIKSKYSFSEDTTFAEGRLVLTCNSEGAIRLFPVVTGVNNFQKANSRVEVIFSIATHLYIAIQFGMRNRPEVFREVPSDSGGEDTTTSKKKLSVKKPVKVVKKIVIEKREVTELIHGHFSKTISCPAWGVSGHYRHYKNGTVVWIKPYVKGPKRNDPSAYTPKTYMFLRDNKLI